MRVNIFINRDNELDIKSQPKKQDSKVKKGQLTILISFIIQQYLYNLLYNNLQLLIQKRAMQSTLFSSFGLLLALMMQSNTNKKPKFAISNQINLLISTCISAHHSPALANYQYEKQHGTPEKKKKTKKNKKINKMDNQQFRIFPRLRLSQEEIGQQWRKKQENKKIKCQTVGREIEALQSYFLDELEAIIPYNGIKGFYRIKIQIPGSTYSNLPIQIKIQQSYPEQLPSIQIFTHNLHPSEKQKLAQIIAQQKQLFQITKNSFPATQFPSHQSHFPFLSKHQSSSSHSHSVSTSLSHSPSAYLLSYYPYILNLPLSISLQLFSPDSTLDPNSSSPPIFSLEIPLSLTAGQKQRQRQKLSSDLIPVSKKNKSIDPISTDKEILQNVVLEILNLDDDEEEEARIKNMQKGKQFEMIKYPNLRGRYRSDYEEIEMIGEGGFGSVYRARHRIDSNIYAIKKMVINYNDPQSRKLQKQVQLLSKLNHGNIVRYHQSWLEDIASVDQLIVDMSITDPQQIDQFNKIWKQYSIQHPNESHSHSRSHSHSPPYLNPNQNKKNEKILENSLQQISQNSHNFQSQQDSVIFGEDIVFGGDFSSYRQEDGDEANFQEYLRKEMEMEQEEGDRTGALNGENDGEEEMKRKCSEIHQFPFKILYIVMEYCGSMTLRDFINKRFDQPNDVKIKLIRGILQGLSYIHSRRMIHRDLKPANIFLLEGTNKVKIGDFGLATIGNIQNNPYQAQIIEYSQKTRGVGTSFYRAPEQFHSSSYDQKIDIYSLGIIMLQMFYKFQTNMQRHDVLNKVTLSHKLPTDFSNIEHNTQFQQQIQSCISLKPSDRPTVQKLLQTFRNKYFTRLVSLIANPKHFQFYQLINHLFAIKNESNVTMKQNLFKNYLTYQLSKIYQIHRGVLFTPLSLIPVSDFDTINGIKFQVSRKQKYLLLSQRGVVMQYPSNAYSSWIRYAKQTMKRNTQNNPHSHLHYRQDFIQTNRQMRRFTFQKVAQYIGSPSPQSTSTKSQLSFKQKYLTAFDISYQKCDNLTPYFLCEMLKISLLIIDTMLLTQRTPPIFLCHSMVFKYIAICYNASIMAVHKFLGSISQEKFRAMRASARLEYMKGFGLDGNFGKWLIAVMDGQRENQADFMDGIRKEMRKRGENKQLTYLIESIQQQIMQTTQLLKIFKLYDRVRWKVQIPPPSTNGIFWTIGPVKGFTSLQQYLPGQQLCNLHLETSLNPSSQQNEADVSIWSNGQFLQKDIMEVVAKCWENDITAKWYEHNLGEKDLSCRHNIILKKKNQRVYMMLRKNHIGFERILEKKSSEELKDKQEKQSAFILKEHFNYQVLKHLNRQNHKKISGFH